MDELGPAWFLKELPYPIALPWQVATHHGPLEGMAVAGVVEMALKVVTGLQVSAYLATRRQWPAMLSGERFKTLTLGNLKKLSVSLRDELARQPVVGLAALGQWPGRRVEELLDAVSGRRNQLAHQATLSPGLRAELTAGLARDAVQVLESLAWLRELEVCVFTEGAAFVGGRGLGREQVFRGTESHPATRRVSWEGELVVGRTYVRGRSDGGQAVLLDVEPFLTRDRLGKSRLDELCLWNGLNERMEVRLSEFTSGSEVMKAVEVERPRISKIKIYALHDSSTSLTRHEGERIEAVGAPAEAEATRPRAKKTWPWVVAGLGVAALGVAALAVASSADEKTGGAGVEGGSEAARVERSEALVGGDAPPTCELPDIAHRWTFDTVVLGGKVGAEYGLNVRGHYAATIRRVGCTLVADVVKTGWTQSGKFNKRVQEGSALLTVSGSAGSAASSFSLRVEAGDPEPARVAFRLGRFGPHLIGLWRHEGADYERGGYWGTVFGLREGWTGTPPDSACFEECGRRCMAGRDPLDEETEACLLECGRALMDCEG